MPVWSLAAQPWRTTHGSSRPAGDGMELAVRCSDPRSSPNFVRPTYRPRHRALGRRERRRRRRPGHRGAGADRGDRRAPARRAGPLRHRLADPHGSRRAARLAPGRGMAPLPGPDRRDVMRHGRPNGLVPVVAITAVQVAVVPIETCMSFLGVVEVALGRGVQRAASGARVGAGLPGPAIMLPVLVLDRFGNSRRDWLNPALAGRRACDALPHRRRQGERRGGPST